MRPPRALLYIDGFNFYYRVKKYCPGRMYLGWCDFRRLAEQHLLPAGVELPEILYFTAPVGHYAREPQEREKQELWLRAVSTIAGLRRIDGYYAPDEKKKRVEKQTDVNIAVGMVRDAAQREDYDRALLITEDLDLRPAACAVADWQSAGISVTVWCPPGPISRYWHKGNPERLHCQPLTPEMLADSRLREDFEGPDGPIHCRDEWRVPNRR